MHGAAMLARCRVKLSSRFKLDWSWPAPWCVYRAFVAGVPRRGALVPARLCLDEHRAAPIPPAADVRGFNVSFRRDHARNNLCKVTL